MAQAQALRQSDSDQQLAFHDLGSSAGMRARVEGFRGRDVESARHSRQQRRAEPHAHPRSQPASQPKLCNWCQAKEARYGFRPEGVEAATTDRPRALCFECFRAELDRRRRVAERMAKGWNASQVGLPLEDTLNELTRRRRRAQIAARHALGL
jgi:hypothetical protein